MKKLKKLWLKLVADLKSATPKIYKWIMGILIGLAGMAVTISYAFDTLPAAWQTLVPETILKGLAGLALLGAVLAKKQNIKSTDPPATIE